MAWPRRSKTAGEVGRLHGFRSGLEDAISAALTTRGISFAYEALKIPFLPSPKPRKYTPDFLLPNGIIVESKGRFLTEDRQKHKLVKEQHPDLDIRFVFSRSATPISKQSKTTYAVWATSHGFRYADVQIPDAWLMEPPNLRSLAAIKRLQESTK